MQAETGNGYEYWCFISYRHADNREQDRGWASWLHREIERYEIPAELVGTVNGRGEVIPERIYPIFRDEDSLPAEASLADSISRALDRSRFLVVLCSPRAVRSRYVAEEILHFKKSGKEDRILAAIIAGEPGGGEERECFPLPLLHPVSVEGGVDGSRYLEPVAADFRLADGSEGFTSAEAYRLRLRGAGDSQGRRKVEEYDGRLQLMKLKIIAGILGLPLERLRDRDRMYQLELARKRARVRGWLSAGFAVVAGVAAVAGVVAVGKQREAEAAKAEESRQRGVAEESLRESQRQRYLGGVNAAAALLERQPDPAREILIGLPKEEREWEWGVMLDVAGPPGWKIETPFEAGRYHPDGEISALLAPAVQEVLRVEESMHEEVELPKTAPMDASRAILVPERGVAVYYEFSGARHGAYLVVTTLDADLSEMDMSGAAHSGDPRVLRSAWSGNYGGFSGAAVTEDGSLLLVGGSTMGGFAPSETYDVGEKVAGGRAVAEEEGNAIYVMSLPRGAVEEGGDEESGEEGPSHRTVWQRVRWDLLSKEEQGKVREMEKGGEGMRRFADFQVVEGEKRVLLNVLNGEWAAEVRALESGETLARLGGGVKLEDADYVWMFTDCGGAFSEDGSLVVVCPGGVEQSHGDAAGMYGDIAEYPAAVFGMNGALVSVLQGGGRFEYGRSAEPMWGFSPDKGMVFQSSLSAADPVNVIFVNVTDTGRRVEEAPEDSRYIAWSPDSEFVYMVGGNSSSMEVYRAGDFSRVGSIANVALPSAYPVFHHFSSMSVKSAGRYVIGGLVFGKDPASPLLRMKMPSDEGNFPEEMRKGFFPDAGKLDAARRALVHWVVECDRRSGGR